MVMHKGLYKNNLSQLHIKSYSAYIVAPWCDHTINELSLKSFFSFMTLSSKPSFSRRSVECFPSSQALRSSLPFSFQKKQKQLRRIFIFSGAALVLSFFTYGVLRLRWSRFSI
jgi:hypothetical protein